MANIIEYGNQYINLDYLVRAYKSGNDMILEMANGHITHLPLDSYHLLSGRESVVQILPTEGLYADYIEADGLCQDKVLFMGVCANGEVRPLGGLRDACVYFMDEGNIYDGLSDKKKDEQNDGLS